jgi:[protein-PII] uridylyltransferase
MLFSDSDRRGQGYASDLQKGGSMSVGAREETASLEGMPAAYYSQHEPSEQRAHARVSARRGARLVQAELCPGPVTPERAEWLCVVTDDRPGLLSQLSAAISAHSLDILSARVYCRVRPGRPEEAVDLFAVRPLRPAENESLDPGSIALIRATMESLLRGETEVSSLEKRAADTVRPPRAPAPVVYFDAESPSDLLVVEAGDRPGLLLAISLTIFRERLSIVRSHVTTSAATAKDEFELAELDGRRLSAARREAVAEKVRVALEQERTRRSSSLPAPR